MLGYIYIHIGGYIGIMENKMETTIYGVGFGVATLGDGGLSLEGLEIVASIRVYSGNMLA